MSTDATRHTAAPAETPTRTRFLHPGMKLPFIVIVSCFAAWGLAGNMTDPLVRVFGSVFSMTAFQSSLVQFAYYGAYFALALPAAWLNTRFGFRGGVLIGLGLAAGGGFLFLPAAHLMTYGWFLLALFTLASGLSILETSANPYVMAMGPEDNATRRLNVAQAFNPIGSNLGVLIAAVAILPFISEATAEDRARLGEEQLRAMQSEELQAVMLPYVALASLYVIIAIIIALVKVPPHPRTVASHHELAESTEGLPGNAFTRLLTRRLYSYGVIAQFFNIAAQTCIWTFTLHYASEQIGASNTEAGYWLQASVLMFLVFRFVMVALMGRFDPRILLTVMTVAGTVLSLVSVTIGGMAGMVSLVLLSACISLLFPTIYGVALQGVGPDAKWGAAGLVMAIIGGAVMPLVQGRLLDLTSAQTSYLVVAVCFAIIAGYGFYSLRYGARELASPVKS